MGFKDSRITKKCRLPNECFHIRNVTKQGQDRGGKRKEREMISLLNFLKGGTNEKEALFSKILELEPEVPRAQGMILLV